MSEKTCVSCKYWIRKWFFLKWGLCGAWAILQREKPFPVQKNHSACIKHKLKNQSRDRRRREIEELHEKLEKRVELRNE